MKPETNSCGFCGARIRWWRTDRGHTLPFEPDPDDSGGALLREDGRMHVIVPGDIYPPGAFRYALHKCYLNSPR